MRHSSRLAANMARLTPTEINLRELPAEGRDYVYTSESGELRQALKDLLGNNTFEVRFRIMPMGNAFDLKGTLKANLDLQCSLCAIDFKFPVSQNLHELLLVQRPLAKGDQLTKANHAHEWESQGPDYIMLDSETFRVKDYVHEAIGLSEPIRPLGKPDCDVNCENLTEPLKKWLHDGSENIPDPIKTNPFHVLEKIKLKS